MARLSMAQRRALPKSAFAVPSKAPGPGSYPMPDAKHAAVAKGRAKEFASPAMEAAVVRKANRKLGKVKKPAALPRSSGPGNRYDAVRRGEY